MTPFPGRGEGSYAEVGSPTMEAGEARRKPGRLRLLELRLDSAAAHDAEPAQPGDVREALIRDLRPCVRTPGITARSPQKPDGRRRAGRPDTARIRKSRTMKRTGRPRPPDSSHREPWNHPQASSHLRPRAPWSGERRRLVPAFPFFAIHTVMALTPMRTITTLFRQPARHAPQYPHRLHHQSREPPVPQRGGTHGGHPATPVLSTPRFANLLSCARLVTVGPI